MIKVLFYKFKLAELFAIVLVSIFLSILFFDIVVLSISDFVDHHKALVDKNFDSYQHTYCYFIKNKYHKDRRLRKTFSYIFQVFSLLIKHGHKLNTIFHYYSNNYSRTMRSIDFLLNFFLTIFFSLLPLYIYDDEEKKLIMTKRDLTYVDFDINTIGLKLKEVN